MTFSIDKIICPVCNQKKAHLLVDAQPNEWKLAVDHELVTFGFTADSFKTPKEAINALIDWHVAIATDPALRPSKEPITQQSSKVVECGIRHPDVHDNNSVLVGFSDD